MSDSCDPMDCSPPGSSVRGILQARILEWGAISFSRGISTTQGRTLILQDQGSTLVTSFNLNDIQGGPISKHGHTSTDDHKCSVHTIWEGPPLLQSSCTPRPMACFWAAGAGGRRGPPRVLEVPTGHERHLLDACGTRCLSQQRGPRALSTSSPALTSPRSKGSSPSTLAAAIPTRQLPA